MNFTLKRMISKPKTENAIIIQLYDFNAIFKDIITRCGVS